jgi:hypothetical protein
VEISHDGIINYQTGIDYDINRSTGMSLVADGLLVLYREHGQYENQYLDVLTMQDSMMISDSHYKNYPQRNSFNYNFHHTFNGGKKELNIYLDYLSFTPHSHQTLLSDVYYPGNVLTNGSALLTKYEFTADIYSAKADYSDTIFKTVKIEQGVQTLYSQRDNNSRYLTQNGNGTLEPDQLLNNSFRYSEAIRAAYINLQHHSKKYRCRQGCAWKIPAEMLCNMLWLPNRIRLFRCITQIFFLQGISCTNPIVTANIFSAFLQEEELKGRATMI